MTLQLPIYSGPVKFDRGSEELQGYRFYFYKIPSRFPCFTADTCNQVREAFFILTIFNNYSPKAKLILLNNPRDEVEGIIQQY